MIAKLLKGFLLLLVCIGMGCNSSISTQSQWEVQSLDGHLSLQFFLNNEGAPGYLLKRGGETVIDSSYLGFSFIEQADFRKDLKVVESSHSQFSETWSPLWGERSQVKNQYRELKLTLQESKEPGRKMDLIFRLFNDGLGFRYGFPVQAGPSEWQIADEWTEFKMTGDHTAWWIPADYDSYEHLYHQTPISGIDATPLQHNPSLIASTIQEVHATNTPVTFKASPNLYLSISEAALVQYSEMTLKVNEDKRTLQSSLVPSPHAWKAKVKLPFLTPWRTITVGHTPADLAASDLIVNLNEPSKIKDPNWIHTGKYVGIWWGMHIDKFTWHQGPKHGATTEHAKEMIDFAAANGFSAVLIEGWNTGWENWFDAEGRINAFDWVTPYDDFDLKDIVAYGKQKGVNLIGHHETSAVVYKYDSLMDAAFAQCEALGIPAVKTGYVGKILPKGEYHHGQWMVEHYQRSVETAARHHVMLDIHEPIKPTGLRRTWPNLMTREGVRGTEFNAWSDGNPPSHITILPFTRGLAGPIDYTPGIFELTLKPWKPDNRMHSTLCNQLAQMVVIYSPWTMAADLPENYQGHPAFQFIKDLATDWDESHVLAAEIGQFVATARKAKGTENWFLGAVTNEKERTIELNTEFLPLGKSFLVTKYLDSSDAHYHDNPGGYIIEKTKLIGGETLILKLAPGGGAAVVFTAE